MALDSYGLRTWRIVLTSRTLFGILMFAALRSVASRPQYSHQPASAPTPNGRTNLHALPLCRLACVSREGARGWAVRRPVTKHGAPRIVEKANLWVQGRKESEARSLHESEHHMARKPCKSPAEKEHLALKRSVEVFLGL